MEKFIPRDTDGKLILFTGIENLVEIEEKLHVFMARPEVNLSHILNVYGDLDRMPVCPQDAYVRTQWAALGHVQYLHGTEDKKISEYEKKMEVWSKDCGMAMPIVKSIYSEQIKLELRQYLPPAQYMNPSRDNINRIMQRVRVIHGGYSVQKSDLSVQRFKDTPKFTSANSVAPTLIQMRYEIKLRESWSDLALGVDYRFTEAEKKSRLVSLLDAWDELKILHTRLWSTAVQNGLTFEQIVDEIMVSIQPLQERELIEQQMAAMTDRNHGTQHVSMSAYNNSNSPRKLEHGRKCFNCGSLDGHRSTECTAPKCSWCNTVWASIRAPGYHHNTRCPQKGNGGGKSSSPRPHSVSPQGCLNCESNTHDISRCMKPMCYKCGTTWLSKSNPAYHHFDKCPYPQVKQSSTLGKRPNPYASSQSRAHMSQLRDQFIEEQEQSSLEQETGDWSDEEVPEPWQKPEV